MLPGLWPRVTRSYEPIPPPTPIVSFDLIFPILSTPSPSSKTTISTHSLTPDPKQAHPRWLCQYVTHTHFRSLTVPFDPASRDQLLTKFSLETEAGTKRYFMRFLFIYIPRNSITVTEKKGIRSAHYFPEDQDVEEDSSGIDPLGNRYWVNLPSQSPSLPPPPP